MIRLSSRGDVAELIDLPAEVVRSDEPTVEARMSLRRRRTRSRE